MQLLDGLGQRGNTVVGRERNPYIGQSDLVSKEVDEVSQFTIEIQSHLLQFWRVGADLVTKDVVGRKADRKKVGCRATANVLVDHQLLGKLEFVLVGERSRPDDVVETGMRTVCFLAMRGRTED